VSRRAACLRDRAGAALFDSAPVLVAVVDAAHRIVAFNPAFEQVFGQREGQTCYQVYKGRESICERCMLDEVFVDGVAREVQEQGVTAADGRARVLQVRLVPLMSDARVDQVMQICVDQTRLQELEQGLDQAERLANVGLTTAGLAHTIKNILAGLEGGIYVVNSGLDKDDTARLKAGWTMVQRYIEQVASLVQNLLRYARAQEPIREAVEPAELVRRVIELYESKAELQGIELQGRADSALDPIQADPEALHACLTNLVANAMDACTWDPDTDKAHWIHLTATPRHEGGLVLTVQDNGMGISEENQRRVLSMHFTTKGIRGTGLGLLLTKKAVAEHGGQITFQSTPGQGTSFRIELPAAS